MMREATLTRRERQVAELFAWGATKKDVANRLYVSTRTVENHARNIFEKTGCTKVNELSAWWFCTNFNISFDLSPLRRRVIALVMLAVIIPQMVAGDITATARTRTVAARTCRARGRSSSDGEDYQLF